MPRITAFQCPTCKSVMTKHENYMEHLRIECRYEHYLRSLRQADVVYDAFKERVRNHTSAADIFTDIIVNQNFLIRAMMSRYSSKELSVKDKVSYAKMLRSDVLLNLEVDDRKTPRFCEGLFRGNDPEIEFPVKIKFAEGIGRSSITITKFTYALNGVGIKFFDYAPRTNQAVVRFSTLSFPLLNALYCLSNDFKMVA